MVPIAFAALMAHEQNAPTRFAPPASALRASNGVALYVQLADLFRHHILSGAWPEGHRLDNFDLMAEHYDVARVTVRQAVARLVKEGLLTSQRGRGTFVQSRAATDIERPAAVDVLGHSDDPLRIDILYRQRATTLPGDFRGDFDAFERYVEISKVHTLGDVPFAMVRVFVAEPVYLRFPRRAIEKEKILRLVFAHGGDATAHMRQRITVEPADVIVANQLAYALGSPVAKILRQIHGADRKLSYAGLSWYRGDFFEMDMTLPRDLIVGSPPALIAPKLRASRKR